MEYTRSEISTHKTPESCWIIIDDYVFDVTSYLSEHPGGRSVLLEYSGNDATIAFNDANHVDGIRLMENYCIGKVSSQLKK
jgi:cytochrome b involved in lipid metabolism